MFKVVLELSVRFYEPNQLLVVNLGPKSLQVAHQLAREQSDRADDVFVQNGADLLGDLPRVLQDGELHVHHLEVVGCDRGLVLGRLLQNVLVGLVQTLPNVREQ